MVDITPTAASTSGRNSPHIPSADDTLDLELGHQPRKKLRVRKGTKSCWECKRRKIRCTFTSSSDVLCNGCSRRGTTCISQEFPDEPAVLAPPIPGESDRLGRVEALVELLIRNPNPNGSNSNTAVNSGQNDVADVRHRKQPPSRNAYTPQPSAAPSEASFTISPAVPSHTRVGVLGRHDELSRALVAAWPSPHELDMILEELLPVGVTFAGILHKVDFIPHAIIDNGGSSPHSILSIPTPREELQLPPSGSHPVLIARKLLLLAVYLQSLRPNAKYQQVMSRVVDAAINLVTTKDELTGSLEGIECITLESLYQDNSGNLRRAWLSIRRAVAVAQMMGLHRGSAINTSHLKILEPETRLRINPEYLWFRLIQTDRYFSLMLGLPHSSADNVFATPKALERCTPVERMRRLNTAAGGRILQRNGDDDSNELATTHEIDQLLQKNSAHMPSQWWLSGCDALPLSSNPAEAEEETRRILDETARITDQLAHYQLLVQLHLPYLLRSPSQRKYDYSKMTAVHASRELLRRVLAFRIIYPVGSYCRGFDFNAFIATAALCLAHMEARRQVLAEDGTGGSSVFGFLAHQRPADRGMMERAVESMETMAIACDDLLAKKVSTVLQQLLAIEADAAAGGRYNANSSPAGPHHQAENFGCGSGLDDTGNVLDIFIPYFGVVRIERGGIETSLLSLMTPTSGTQNERERGPNTEEPAAGELDLFFSSDNDDAHNARVLVPELAAGVDDWALQGVDMAFFDNLMRGIEPAAAAEGSWAPWDNSGSRLTCL